MLTGVDSKGLPGSNKQFSAPNFTEQYDVEAKVWLAGDPTRNFTTMQATGLARYYARTIRMFVLSFVGSRDAARLQRLTLSAAWF